MSTLPIDGKQVDEDEFAATPFMATPDPATDLLADIASLSARVQAQQQAGKSSATQNTPVSEKRIASPPAGTDILETSLLAADPQTPIPDGPVMHEPLPVTPPIHNAPAAKLPTGPSSGADATCDPCQVSANPPSLTIVGNDQEVPVMPSIPSEAMPRSDVGLISPVPGDETRLSACPQSPMTGGPAIHEQLPVTPSLSSQPPQEDVALIAPALETLDKSLHPTSPQSPVTDGPVMAEQVAATSSISNKPLPPMAGADLPIASPTHVSQDSIGIDPSLLVHEDWGCAGDAAYATQMTKDSSPTDRCDVSGQIQSAVQSHAGEGEVPRPSTEVDAGEDEGMQDVRDTNAEESSSYPKRRLRARATILQHQESHTTLSKKRKEPEASTSESESTNSEDESLGSVTMSANIFDVNAILEPETLNEFVWRQWQIFLISADKEQL
jgi:hypothetical protein